MSGAFIWGCPTERRQGHLEIIRQGRLIRDTIRGNEKKIRVITSTIRRDRNESLYNLEKYDDEIAKNRTGAGGDYREKSRKR